MGLQSPEVNTWITPFEHKDSILLGCVAYNCGHGVVKKSSILKKLKAGDRNIIKAYTSHCHYKGKRHNGLLKRRQIEK